MRLTGVRICLLANFFFSLFKSHQKSIYFFNKNERNNKKVENKVSGRVRVGIGRQGGGGGTTNLSLATPLSLSESTNENETI